MAGLDDILNTLPIGDIASRLGVDPSVAQQAVQQGGATILSGLQQNAQTPEGSAAIRQALGRHAGQGETVDVGTVDTADGEKILGHIFGGQEQQVAQHLTDSPQTAGIDFGKLLPMLAPVVMGLLAKKNAADPAPGSAQEAAGQDQGGGIGGLIGGLLGGGASGGQSGGFDVGGLLGGLGGLFGGGR